MKDIFYRVGNYSDDEIIILDSDSYNYGKSFSSNHDHFLNCYFNIATKIDLPVDFLIFVNNGLAILGTDFIHSNIIPAIVDENYIDLQKVTKNEKHKRIVIPISLLNEFIQSFDDQNPFYHNPEGKYLWEQYFDLVRKKIFPSLPNRKESIFLFDNIEACEYYINTHRKGVGKIYKVELLHTRALFKADMKIFDDIDLSISHNCLLFELFKYWNAESSKSPIYEYLFQGKCKLKKI